MSYKKTQKDNSTKSQKQYINKVRKLTKRCSVTHTHTRTHTQRTKQKFWS